MHATHAERPRKRARPCRRPRRRSGVAPAQAELQLGIQDDALLTSQEPNAWPFAKGLDAQGRALQRRLGAGRHGAPEGARRPGRPRLRLQARRRDGAADRGDRRAEPVHDRQRAALGQRQPRAALRADERRRVRAVLRQRRVALLGHLHAARRAHAAAGGQELHGLERAQPRPVPDAAGPRRADGRAHVRGASCAPAPTPCTPSRRTRASPPGRSRAAARRAAHRRSPSSTPTTRPAARARRRSRSTRT